MDDFQTEFSSYCKNLFDTGEGSDLTVICGVDTYKVHTTLLCYESDVFKANLRNDFRETLEGKIDLSDNDPEAIGLLMQYIYEEDYEIPDAHIWDGLDKTLDVHHQRPECNEDGYKYVYQFPHTCRAAGLDSLLCPHHRCPHLPDDVGRPAAVNKRRFTCNRCVLDENSLGTERILLTHSKVYQVAEKYMVKGLKDKAILKFRDACRVFWNSPSFAEAARHVYDSTPDSDTGLREVVKKCISLHPELNDKPEIIDFLLEYSECAVDLLREQHGLERLSLI